MYTVKDSAEGIYKFLKILFFFKFYLGSQINSEKNKCVNNYWYCVALHLTK